MAVIKAEELLGQFRRNDANDPDRFLTALVAIMAKYPPVVLEKVCDPMNGISSKIDFVPSLREIGDDLNETLRIMIAQWELSRMSPERKQRLAARNDDTVRLPPRPILPGPPQPSETRPNLREKFGENYGLKTIETRKAPIGGNPTERQSPSVDQLSEHYKTHGLAFKKKPHVKEKHNGDIID